MPERTIYSVSEITYQLKQLIETNFSSIWMEGEISNFKHHSSGHMYFSLKDADAEINAVMWRGINQSLKFRPEDGMKVLAQGKISLYPPRGQYQIMVNELQPAGAGELQIAFEQLKRKLQEEGLFDEARKRPLPRYPVKIGIVTSETGAALQDMLNVLQRRAPYIEVLLAPARVQGEGAAPEIVRGIHLLNSIEDLDVIIIGRGGGSLEDLWPFNEEIVARAVARSRLPVVSAVGHEVDYSISDFCADYRAPTPSAAAEVVARDSVELLAELDGFEATFRRLLRGRIDILKNRLDRIESHYAFKMPAQRLATMSQRLDDVHSRMEESVLRLIRERKQQLESYVKQIELVKPDRVLQRGYSITKNQAGDIIRSIEDLNIGDEIETSFAQGYSQSRVIQLGANNGKKEND